MMVKLSSKTTEELKRIGVGVVYFFGSRAQGAYLDKSDYDIGIVLQKRVNNLAKYRLKVYDLLSQDIPDKIDGPKLDISFLQTANPALQMAAIKYGKILFEADPNFRADYEEIIVKLYDDYLPLKREYEEATLSAFK